MASLSAEASAVKGEEKVLLAIVAVRSLPSESLNTTTVDPEQDTAEKAASMLFLIHPFSGGCQVLIPVFFYPTHIRRWETEMKPIKVHSEWTTRERTLDSDDELGTIKILAVIQMMHRLITPS
ncbi:hypothetical protein PIB30_048933 [Stylosanthes scabra]|uniref:Uncharacterized protein n=1 Tax=Stylosanthes scabra TaxID=79078 RepID=A0ABU6YGH0_9FABA|nr:hypothetical protein [Stylosanthes scabra]